jgi:hypothetical protein
VKWSDGTIGIYDTKNGMTLTNENAKRKSRALSKYIKQNFDLKTKIVGGLVNVRDDGTFEIVDYAVEEGEDPIVKVFEI